MPETKKSFQSNGLKILTMLECGAGIVLILLGISLYYFHAITVEYNNLSSNVNKLVNTRPHMVDMLNASDFLTMRTILFIQTRDPKYMNEYYDLVEHKRRRQDLDSVKQYLQDNGYAKSIAQLELGFERSKDLSVTELYAMKLASDAVGVPAEYVPPIVSSIKLSADDESLNIAEKMRKARNMVFGDDYIERKSAINSYIHKAINELSSNIQVAIDEGKSHLETTITILHLMAFCLFALLMILFLLTFLLISRPLKLHIKNMQADRMLDVIGAYEFQYLAHTYNALYEQNKENEALMKFKVEHDALTKVCSRHAFEEQANLLKAIGTPMAMLLIDVDKFKSINDTYGHEMGDTMLVRVADILRHSFRSNDIVARIGGDEFAALLLHVSESEKVTIGRTIDKINAALQNPVSGEVPTSLSIGIAFSPNGYSDDLKQRADAALYVVKEHGRCGYRVYEAGDEKKAESDPAGADTAASGQK